MTGAIIQGSSPFATALGQARSKKSLSVADAAKSLLLSENQVRGLEADDHRSFYSPAYAERAARRYAEWLGVDATLSGAPQVTDDETASRELQPAAARPIATLATRRSRHFRSRFVRWGLTSLLVATLALLLWSTQGRTQSASQPAAVVPDGVPAVELQPAEAPRDVSIPISSGNPLG